MYFLSCVEIKTIIIIISINEITHTLVKVKWLAPN